MQELRAYLANIIKNSIVYRRCIMTTHTIPSFTGRHINGGLSETKHQSRIRNDVYASSRYAKRLEIDHLLEERRIKKMIREMEL